MPAVKREMILRWLRNIVLGLALLAGGYALAGLIGGAIPANTAWRPPAQGIRIFIESNGVHTGLALPVAATGTDWRAVSRAEDLRDPRYAALPYRSFGWGDRAFYLETPTWAHVRPATVLRAALGSERTVLHVDHLRAPVVGPDVRSVLLRPAEYRRLAAFVRAALADGRHAAIPGYGANDAFYVARGRYSAVNTCNAWTGAALRHAGVRVGRWTPFPASVLIWFPQ